MPPAIPRLALLAVLLALAATGCGSPSSQGGSGRKTSSELTKVLATVRGLPPAQREAKLVALAKKEGGSVSFYTTLNPTVLGPLTKKFEAKYGIHVNAFTTEAASLLQRVTQEAKAGRHAVDVIDTGGPELFQLNKQGDLEDFRSPLQARLDPGSVQRGWTTTRYSQFVVGWNTKRVKPGQQPKTWEELAQPKWKGRISFSPDTTGVSLYKALSDYWRKAKGRTQAQSDRIFEGIARNARIVPGFAVNGQLLASGEIDVAPGSVSSNTVDTLRDKGAPLAWQPPVEPIVRQRQGVALVRDAPHPATALLFLDFEMGPGLDVLAADHRAPARIGYASTGGARSTLVDLQSLSAQQAELGRRVDRLAGLGKK